MTQPVPKYVVVRFHKFFDGLFAKGYSQSKEFCAVVDREVPYVRLDPAALDRAVSSLEVSLDLLLTSRFPSGESSRYVWSKGHDQILHVWKIDDDEIPSRPDRSVSGQSPREASAANSRAAGLSVGWS